MQQFSVASWHTKPVGYWLAIASAFTTMASPPEWAIQYDRNLPLFAPPSWLVFGNFTPEQYTERFRAHIKPRMPTIKAWLEAHRDEHVILLCACPDGKFCHRHLLAKILIFYGWVQVPLPEMEAELVAKNAPLTRAQLDVLRMMQEKGHLEEFSYGFSFGATRVDRRTMTKLSNLGLIQSDPTFQAQPFNTMVIGRHILTEAGNARLQEWRQR